MGLAGQQEMGATKAVPQQMVVLVEQVLMAGPAQTGQPAEVLLPQILIPALLWLLITVQAYLLVGLEVLEEPEDRVVLAVVGVGVVVTEVVVALTEVVVAGAEQAVQEEPEGHKAPFLAGKMVAPEVLRLAVAEVTVEGVTGMTAGAAVPEVLVVA